MMDKASGALADAPVFGFCAHSDPSQRAILILHDMMVFRSVQHKQPLTVGDLV